MIRKNSTLEFEVPTSSGLKLIAPLPGAPDCPFMVRPGKMSGSKPAARRWTSGEDDKLRNMLDVGKTADEIAVELDRTHLAIYARLQRLYRKRAREARLVQLGLKAKRT